MKSTGTMLLLPALLHASRSVSLCTAQNAVDMTIYFPSWGIIETGSDSSSSCTYTCCWVDPSEFNECLEFYTIDVDFRKRSQPSSHSLAPRAGDLSCRPEEACLGSSLDPEFFVCANVDTSTWYDELGSTGNFISGNYILADGQQGNIWTGEITVEGDPNFDENAATNGGNTNGGNTNGGTGASNINGANDDESAAPILVIPGGLGVGAMSLVIAAIAGLSL